MQAWSHGQTQPAQQAVPPSPSGADPSRCSAGGANKTSAALRASAPAQHANAEPPASSPPGPGPPPRYAPFLARSTHLVKLPGHSPDQLAPGWEERLREAVAARGRVLVGAYVRAGCIELVLEVHETVSEGEAARAPENCASGGGAGDVVHDGTGDAWLEGNPAFLAALLEALGLPAPAEAAEAGRPAQKLVTSASLHGAFRLPPGPASALVCGPAQQQQQQGHLWLSLSPRVTLLPPAGEAGSLALRLRVAGLPPAAVFIGEEGEGSGSPAAEAATTVPATPAAGSGEPSASAEVLVRSRGSYLPALLRRLDGPAAGASGGAGGGSSAVWLELELALGGLAPGLLQVDVRMGGVPCCALPVLALPAGEGELAAELRGVEAAAADAEGESAGGVQHDTLGDLLYDMGALLYGGAGVRVCDTSPASAGLAAHLLAYAEGTGLKALAAAVRGTGAECGAADFGCAAAAAAGPGGPPCYGSAVAPSGPAPPQEPSAGRRPPAGCVWSDVRSALLLSAGLAREGPAEAEDFRAAAADWAAGQAHIIQALEIPSALALLRRHSDPRVGTLLLWLLRISASLTTAAAWPLLPPVRWRRLAVAARVPRYAAGLVCKALALTLGLGLQPGLAALYPGVGLLFAEGLLLPATCPLPLAASLALSALRLPLNAGLMSLGLTGGGGGGAGGGGGGGAPAPLPRIAIGWRGLLLAARVEVVALATTLACHVYLRLMRGRRRAGRALAAQQQAGQPRQMDDKRETCAELWRDETCRNS